MSFGLGRGVARLRAVRMRLHNDWRRIARRSWSFRLSLGAGVLEAANVACEFIPRDTTHRVVLGLFCAVVCLSAAGARLFVQTNLGSD